MSNKNELKKHEKRAKQDAIINKIMFIPIVLLLAVVPLIMRLELVVPNDYVANALRNTTVVDFFSQYKSYIILIITGGLLILTFFVFQKDQLKKDKYISMYLVTLGIFWFFSLLSTLFSAYKQVAIWGLPDRAEGMVITSCYIIMVLYTLYAYRYKENYLYIIGALSVLVIITTILGIFQYRGEDLIIGTEWGNKLVIPKHIADQVEDLRPVYEKGKIYGTMFHYNYMGSFGAMMVPLFSVLTLFIKGYKKKLFLAFMTLASMFLLFGSTSRAGLIGLGVAILMGLLLFSKQAVQKWKIVTPLLLLLCVIVIGFNALTGGTIFERVPTMINDALGLFAPEDHDFEYKDHIPVRDIISHEGQTTIVLQQEELTVKSVDQAIRFVDQAGTEVPYLLQEGEYVTQDPRFDFIMFETGRVNRGEGVGIGLFAKVDGINAFLLKMHSSREVDLVDVYTEERMQLQYPDTYGFKGKERLGSARGYIWSRSIPLLKDTLFLGTGPDTYLLVFPQNDLLGKWWAYETPQMIVDKPHNLYLQFGINNGVIALIAFLAAMGVYFINSIKLYGLKSSYRTQDIMGAATMLAITGYLGAGIFNDSVIAVAPIFWILFGTGIALNYYNKQGCDGRK